MSKVIYSLLMMLASVAFSGCQNNGYIGDLFGTWKLEKITIDGENDNDYLDNVVWKFQNNIIQMQRVNEEEHTTVNTYGTWERPENGVIRLNYTHTDENNPQLGSVGYSPLEETHLPKATISILDILKLDGGKMRLRYISPDGIVYQYFFKKW